MGDRKVKVLWLADTILGFSGFANQTKEVILGLREKGYEIVTFGDALNWKDEAVKISPDGIKIYPIRKYGYYTRYKEVVEKEKPDIFIAFSEVRHLHNLMVSEGELRRKVPMVLWHLWDNPPFPYFNRGFYQCFDQVVCTTKDCFGLLSGGQVSNTSYIPLGVDRKKFHPLPVEEVKEFRNKFEKMCKEEFKFVVGYVGRNIPRKRLPDLIRMFNKFAKGKSGCVLFLHTHPQDSMGPNLMRAREIYVDKENDCLVFMTIPVNQDESFINGLYNVFDVNINVSFAEGFGMPLLEGMAAGCPPITNENSGSLELVASDRGWLLKNAVVHVTTSGFIEFIERNMVSDEAVVKALNEAYEDRGLVKRKGIEAQEFSEHYSIEKTVDMWDKLIQEVIENFKPLPRWRSQTV